MSGLKLATIYGFPPFWLGFCGPKNKQNLKIITNFMEGEGEPGKKVKSILSRFDAAYSYYQLIARANQIKNPFNQKVIEAYWLGNKLLDQIPLQEIKKMITTTFAGPGLLATQKAKQIAGRLPKGVVPHHSLHVFLIGSITNVIRFDTKVRDLCLVMWGKVKKIGQKEIVVVCQPLRLAHSQYFFGQSTEKNIKWNQKWLPGVKVGDWVTFHWGRTCQVINPKERENLVKYTLLNLKAANEPSRYSQ